jgi:hypothetical protein
MGDVSHRDGKDAARSRVAKRGGQWADRNGNGATDVNGTFTVSGGTLTAAGSAGMAGTPSDDPPRAGWW